MNLFPFSFPGTPLRRVTSAAVAAACLSAACPQPLAAQEATADVSAQTSAYRDSIAQDELRTRADRVRQDLRRLLEDYRQNGLAGVEDKQLQEALETLSTIGDHDMLAVVQTLRDASDQDDDAHVRDKLIAASQGQKGVQALLRVLSDRLVREQTLLSMRQRLAAIVLRQTTHLRLTQAAADEAGPDPKPAVASKPRRHAAPAATRPAFYGAEQGAIQTEIALTLEAMQKTVADPAAAGKTAGFAEALNEAQSRQLNVQAANASAAIVQGRFVEAANLEQQVLEGVQAMLEHLDVARPVAERLQEAANRMRDLASEQKQLAELTRNASPEARADLLEKQRRLADRAAASQHEIASLSARVSAKSRDASDALAAVDAMLSHPDALKEEKAGKLPGSKASLSNAQAEAAKKLDATGTALDQQAGAMASAPKSPVSPAAMVASLQQLGQEIGQALDQQKSLAASPSTAGSAPSLPQQQLAAFTASMQEKAQPFAPAAASNLGLAASQMQQQQPPAQSPGPEAGGKTPSSAPPPAQKAADQLARAKESVQQQIKDLMQAIVSQQPLDALAAQLTTAHNQDALVQQTMDRTLTGGLMDAIRQMDAVDPLLQQALVACAPLGPTLPAEVKPDILQAQQHIAQARTLAAQPQRVLAMAENGRCLQALDLALKALQQARATALAAVMPPPAALTAQNSPGQSTSSSPQPGSSSGETPTPSSSAPQTPAAPAAGQPSAGAPGTPPGSSSPEASGAPSGSKAPGVPPGDKAPNAPGAPSGNKAPGAPPGDKAPNTPGAPSGSKAPGVPGEPSAPPQTGQASKDSQGLAQGNGSNAPDNSDHPTNADGSNGPADRSVDNPLYGKTLGTSSRNGVVNAFRNVTFSNSNGPLGTVTQGVSLQPKDRDAITLLQKEKAPAGYSSMIEQYTKNLADGGMP